MVSRPSTIFRTYGVNKVAKKTYNLFVNRNAIKNDWGRRLRLNIQPPTVCRDEAKLNFGLELVNSQKSSIFVIPANAGIQEIRLFMDPRFRGGDGLGDSLRDHHV